MYEEHAMTAIYMDAEMSHHGDPGSGDNTESYHPGLVIEQLNKVCFSRQQWLLLSRFFCFGGVHGHCASLFCLMSKLAVIFMHMASMASVANVVNALCWARGHSSAC